MLGYGEWACEPQAPSAAAAPQALGDTAVDLTHDPLWREIQCATEPNPFLAGFAEALTATSGSALSSSSTDKTLSDAESWEECDHDSAHTPAPPVLESWIVQGGPVAVSSVRESEEASTEMIENDIADFLNDRSWPNLV